MVDSALAVRRRWAEARTNQELRELVLARLCHTMRTSLHVIQGYAEMLRTDARPDAIGDLAVRLGSASETALGLMRSYLDLARMESPQIHVRREPVSIEAIVGELSRLATDQIGTRAIRFVTRVSCHGMVVETDSEKLYAILSELVTNAVKFSVSGDVVLAVHSEPGEMIFVLSDSGPGVAARDLPSLFAPFRQGREEGIAATPGQGVGLAIALRLSDLLGATLAYDPGTPSGSVFTLCLPAESWIQETEPLQPILH
jgi:signal transduction histidine kinase